MMKHFRKDKYFRADKYFRTDKYPPKMSALLRKNLYENPPEGALSRCLAALPDPPAAPVRQSLACRCTCFRDICMQPQPPFFF